MDVHESDRAPENPRPSSNHAENDDRTNRHGKSKSSWGLSTAVHAVHGVGFVAKKVVNNRLTESLWHSRKSTSSASVPSDASDTPDAKRENHLSDETVEDDQAPRLHESENAPLKGRNVNDQLEGLKPQDGSHGCTTGAEVVDRSENTKPTDGSHVKPVNKHRWPSSSIHGSTVWPSGTGSNAVDHLGNPKPSASSHARQVNQHRWPSSTNANVVNQSENNLEALDGPHARLVNQHRWPGTVGSNLLGKSANHPSEASRTQNPKRNSKPLQESSSDATNLPSSSLVDDGKSKTDKLIESQPSSPKKSYALASRGVSPSRTRIKPFSVVRGTNLGPASISASDTATATRGVSPLPASRGVSPSPATIEASPAPTVSGSSRLPPARGASPTPTTRSGCPPSSRDIHTSIRSSSPRKSDAVNTVSSFPESGVLDKEIGLIPTRGLSPTPSREVSPTPSRGVSPTPTRGVGPRARDVSPTSVKPSKSSGRRHFFHANILSMFTKIVDNRKEKNVTNLKEVAQQLELLYNIQVQWQFANASAEAALDLQRTTAEKSLFDVWRAILELRDSLASKKVDIVLLILQLKLYAVLYRQMGYIDEWASIQKEHETALYATTNDLQARSLSLPITGGLQADIKGLKLIIFSTIQVLQATISCIQSTLSKLDKTHFLASELANLVLHERALLDECEIFLASAAPLHIEECSLRSYLIQSNQTSMTE